MSDLVPCGECRRHVSAADQACPFCGTAREVSTPGPSRFGRASRAAVFAGAALATSACGGKQKAETIDNNQQAAQSDAGVQEEPPPPPPEDPNNMPMPYGAPPARSRVV